MQGFLVEEFGGPEVMVWSTLPDPVPGPGQVVMEVKASGINFAETRMRAGTYSGQPLPYIAGMEGAGLVHSVGEGVSDFRPGQRVFGRTRGCHAELVLVDQEHLMALPDELSFVEGAAIPVGWQTAWHALHTVADVGHGKRVLIEAVASSVGSAALQIAKAHDCWVAGTASRDDKLTHGQPFGLDLPINYKTENVAERVAAATSGEGIDVGLMTIGQETAAQLFDSMAMDGKIVMYGSTGGRDITFNLNIGTRNLSLMSMSISTSAAFMAKPMPDFRARAIPLFAAGKLKAVVAETLDISELVRAHAMVDERSHYGKIILTLD